MECICLIKDIYRAINEFEDKFLQDFGICINEGLILCSLRDGRMSSSEIAEQSGLKFSYASKIIKSVEDKGYVERSIGSVDKRHMNFELTDDGIALLNKIDNYSMEIPEILKPVFKCNQVIMPVTKEIS